MLKNRITPGQQQRENWIDLLESSESLETVGDWQVLTPHSHWEHRWRVSHLLTHYCSITETEATLPRHRTESAGLFSAAVFASLTALLGEREPETARYIDAVVLARLEQFRSRIEALVTERVEAVLKEQAGEVAAHDELDGLMETISAAAEQIPVMSLEEALDGLDLSGMFADE